MKRGIIVFLSSIILLQATHMHAMSDSWQRGKAAVQSRMQKARAAVAQSKTLQAVSKFVQRKPLSAQEKVILKRVSLTAAMVAIVAAATGLSAAAVRQRMASNRDQAIRELQEKPFELTAAPLQTSQENFYLMQAPSEQRDNYFIKQASEQGVFGNPQTMMANMLIIKSILGKNQQAMREFYCQARNAQEDSAVPGDRNGYAFAQAIAQKNGFALGALILDYLVEKEASFITFGQAPVLSTTGKALEERLNKMITNCSR